MRYLVILEETSTGYSAYSPDVPGCVATGNTVDDAEREMAAATEFDHVVINDSAERAATEVVAIIRERRKGV